MRVQSKNRRSVPTRGRLWAPLFVAAAVALAGCSSDDAAPATVAPSPTVAPTIAPAATPTAPAAPSTSAVRDWNVLGPADAPVAIWDFGDFM